MQHIAGGIRQGVVVRSTKSQVPLNAENPEKALTEVIALSGLPNPAPTQSPEGLRPEASPKATFPLLQARSPKAPSVLRQPRRSDFELSSHEEASHSRATHPFPGEPLVPESGFSFPRNLVSPEGDTNTSAGRPQRPEGPPGTDNPYELPLPLRSPPKWLPRPKPLSFPNGPSGTMPFQSFLRSSEGELICHPTPTQAHSQPRFRDPKTNFANHHQAPGTG